MSGSLQEYPSDWTPLHIAVWRHDSAQVSLLANSSSVNQTDDEGWTPVHLSCAAELSSLYSFRWAGDPDRNDIAESLGLGRKPPRGVSYSNCDDEEQAAAMGILDILLEHNPKLDGWHVEGRESRKKFHTPLHCAASSGWLSHAQALVEAGARVHTGPGCSPICWAKGGSAGNHPVAVYLREQLEEADLALIQGDHLYDPSGAGINEPDRMFHAPTGGMSVSLKNQSLCPKCAGISFTALCQSLGYLHLSSAALLRQSATDCTFCSIINQVLGEDGQLDKRDNDQIILRISNGSKRHRGCCSDPPILRVLEFRLVSSCTCPPVGFLPPRAGDFSSCLGSCDGFQGTEVQVDIFSGSEMTLTIPREFDAEGNSWHSMTWSVPKGTEIDPDPLSSKSMSIVGDWIESCGNSHQHCRRRGSSDPSGSGAALPTRVIDVLSQDMSEIRLCDGSGKHGRYLALSHRWVSGPMPQWVTTKAVLKSRQESFLLQSLPASIVDAVQVTRKLGVRYLWVDSLCIIQDSPEDWDVESSRMAGIYANAHITLFADCGVDDDHGFIFPRNTPSSVEVSLPKGDGTLVTFNMCKPSPSSFKAVQSSLFATNVEESHLSDRGWIFQERILSRRILHFGKDQMFWECSEGTFAENGHVVLRQGLKECGQREGRFSKLAYATVLDGTSPMPLDAFSSQWESLVKNYCTLKLTRGEDKLPALSGLAAAFGARTEDNDYVAGVWKQNLPRQLAWSITNTKPEKAHRTWQSREHSDGSFGGGREMDDSFVHPSQLLRRPSDYRAPSFSWVAIDGEIEFHELPGACATIESVALDLPPGTPYGRPRHGSLTITGSFRQAWSYGPFKEDLGARKAGYIPLYDTEVSFGYLLPDSQDDVDEREVYCLKLGGTKYETEMFLALVPVQGANLTAPVPGFRRIGLGRTMERESEFFVDAEVRTIMLL